MRSHILHGTNVSPEPWIKSAGTVAFLTSLAELQSSSPYPAFFRFIILAIWIMGNAGRWYMEWSTWVKTSFADVNPQSDIMPFTWAGSSSPAINTVAPPMEVPWRRISASSPALWIIQRIQQRASYRSRHPNPIYVPSLLPWALASGNNMENPWRR